MPTADVNKTGRWVLTLAVIASLTLAAAITVGRRTMRMTSAMASAAEEGAFSKLAAGSKTQAVVEIASIPSAGEADGKLLDREREDLYRRTATSVKFSYGATTPVVMGKPDDVKPNAVVFVKGTVRDDHGLAAEQVVILTGYVQVH